MLSRVCVWDKGLGLMDNELKENTTYSVILLAAGKGLRMGGSVKKQFLDIAGHPLITYPLAAFEKSAAAEVILVTASEDIAYVKRDIVEAYHFEKVSAVVAGGSERYLSVYEGLKQVSAPYVLIHDGARVCVTQQIIADVAEAAVQYQACEAAVPSTDTVKLADDAGFVSYTPDRSHVWSIQTPQGFATALLKQAYERLVADNSLTGLTDDAMVVERAFPEKKIRLVMGAYENIKVTTPKDLVVAEGLLQQDR